ncbi:MAG: hypothetical protein QMD65_02500 [Patescibacteria group bacterium]|nr:hypothetical protein [Patescibacteria group bacterium]
MQNSLFKLSKYKQLLNIAAELLRAKEWSDNPEMFRTSLERALGLVDLLLTDLKWRDNYYPLSQKATGVSPWMNAKCGPSEARRTKEGALADSAEEIKDITAVSPWGLHFLLVLREEIAKVYTKKQSITKVLKVL